MAWLSELIATITDNEDTAAAVLLRAASPE
jgi:3-methyladenine DNA glycosylase Mpg